MVDRAPVVPLGERLLTEVAEPLGHQTVVTTLVVPAAEDLRFKEVRPILSQPVVAVVVRELSLEVLLEFLLEAPELQARERLQEVVVLKSQEAVLVPAPLQVQRVLSIREEMQELPAPSVAAEVVAAIMVVAPEELTREALEVVRREAEVRA